LWILAARPISATLLAVAALVFMLQLRNDARARRSA